MTDIDRDIMLQQVHQAMFGVKDTEETGIVGDIKEIKKTVKDVCSDQNKLNSKVHNLIWYLIGSGVITAGAGISFLKMVIG